MYAIIWEGLGRYENSFRWENVEMVAIEAPSETTVVV